MLGLCRVLAGKGNKVALLDLYEEAAKRVADKITAAGGNAKAYKCNVLDKANIEEVHGKVLKDLGKCDILINGAGEIIRNAPRRTRNTKMAMSRQAIS